MLELGSGFRGRHPCPLYLLDDSSWTELQLVPLGRGHQTTPIYSGRVWERDSEKIMNHCKFLIEEVIHVTAMDTRRHGILLAAQIRIPDQIGNVGWINLWNGAELNMPGTLFCACLEGPCIVPFVPPP